MTYERVEHWPTELARAIHAAADRPFVWGEHDCALWVSDCILAMTGFDPLAAYRGRYSTPRGALRALRRVDGVRLPVDLADKLWGPREHISCAKLGDVVAADLGEPREMGPSLGLCYGRSSLFVGTDAGRPGLIRLDTLSLDHCYTPWASSSRPSSPSSRPPSAS